MWGCHQTVLQIQNKTMTKIKESWKAKGYIDEPVPEGIDLKKEIRRLCEEKNAVILSHYDTEGDLQDIADFVGDSLALAQKAAICALLTTWSSLALSSSNGVVSWWAWR